MSTEPPASAHARVAWPRLAGRLDPFLDPVIGVGAVALALTSLLLADLDQLDPRLREPNALAVVATAVAAGSLAWRRKRPRAAYAVFLVGSLVVSGSGHYIASLSVLLLLSLYSLTTNSTRRDAAIGLGVGMACFVGLALVGVPDLGRTDLLLSLALLVAAWAVGEVVRARRDLQRDQVRAAIAEERLRIARELHDVVAHSMSLIAVQAGVGAHVIGTDPGGARRALEIIAETSRRALEQTRSMLGMLREEDEDGRRPPAQGLDDLPALVTDVGAAGLEVDLVRSGTVPQVDATVSLTAYRIMQESLTNVIKHSAAPSATITLSATEEQLDIDVRDPGPTRRAGGVDAGGHGLVGLTERVRLVGGALTYGPQDEGFRVHAALPTRVGR